jgi:amino acid adenylation domain-containing protein
MNALELIARLRAAGIRLSLHEGNIRLKAEKGSLSEELRQAITAQKQEIIALLGTDAGSTPPLVAAPRTPDTTLPLSYAQQRLWFLDELEPGTPVYNMPFAVRVRGRLNMQALDAAFCDLTIQHETLRTVFVGTAAEPVQRILPQVKMPLHIEDLTAVSQVAIIERLRELAKEHFNLAQGPLLKLHVLQTGTDDYLLLLVIHHIICDLWSMDIFFRDLGRWYEHHIRDVAPKPPALAVQYADYALWQRQLLSGDRLQRHVEYWLRQLAEAPPVLELVSDRPRPAEPGYRGSWQSIRLPATLSEAIPALAKSSGCTLFMLTFSAFAALLHKYSGEDDFVIGTPISGRQHTELEQLIGFFLNTLALRVKILPTTSFRELLYQIKATALDAYAHQELPFEKLVEELQPERDMSHTPVFQHMFIWQESAASRITMADLTTEPATLIGHDTAKFDLTLAMTNGESGIEAGIEYNTDIYNGDTIGRMLSHLRVLLTAVTASPDSCLADLQLLDDAERMLVTDTFNATTVDFGRPGCVHELVAQQVRKSPAATAVAFGSRLLSYAELERRASVLAHQLQQLGVAPGRIVAISCERSLELPVAALAVLKAGGCYLAVDPHYPAERIAAMLDDSAAHVVLTQSGVELPPHDAPTIRLDEFDFSGSNQILRSTVRPDDALYCIYTSGSTGKPKGVQLSHAGLWLRWQQQHERLGTAARTLQFASFSFDVSFQEMFSTWSTGGTLVMVDEELRQDLPRLAVFIAEQEIQRLYLPYAALQPIAETLVSLGLRAALQDVVVAGEALQVSPIVRALFSNLEQAALHNQYGPSETHVVTALTLTGSADEWPALPSIGTPVANTRAYVLDSKRRPVPIGVPGELYIGGIQVGIGYLHRPELNAEKFLASPFNANDRLYRTGDRVRYAANGTLEFLGRADDQVKWRGFRVEPGEIEAALLALPEVRQAAVMVRSDGPGGIRQLVGYVTGSDDLDPTTLRKALKDRLPDYMVPSVIAVMDALPLTPSGKVARRKLPPPEYSRDELTPYVAPRNPVEQQLVDIWSQVLGLERAGINDDFFELGGHSLLATQLVSRVRDQFHISLPLKYIFRYPTPANLAETVMTLQGTLQSNATEAAGDRDEFRI